MLFQRGLGILVSPERIWKNNRTYYVEKKIYNYRILIDNPGPENFLKSIIDLKSAFIK